MADIAWKDRGVSPAEQLDRLAAEHPTVEAQLEALHAEYFGLLARRVEIEAETNRLSAELGPNENRRRVVNDLIQHLQGVRSVR